MDRFITAGVAGHVDHGKTSLVRCLTGIDTDRLKEEKRRGLSIEPSVAPLELESSRLLALIDVPGHSDFLKNTIRGLSSVDMAILVVAADDGVMPQTRDHLEVLKFLRAEVGLAVVTKTDLVDEETVDLAEMEIREILEGSFLENRPVVPFSATDGRGLDQILRALEQETNRVAGKTARAPFRLWIDQVRSFPGFGTVASGTIVSGIVKCGDMVQLQPSGKEAKVRFLEVHHQRVEAAYAGQRVGLNLHGVTVSEVGLGTALTAPGLLRPAGLLNVELSVLPTVRRPLMNRQRVKLYVGTHCSNALLVIMEKDHLQPGETGLVQFRLQQQIAVPPRDPFVISPINFHRIIGGGIILETPREKFRAAKAEKTLPYLQPLQRKNVKRVVSLYFSRCANRPVTAEEIASYTGFAVEEIQAAIRSKTLKGKLLDLEGRGYFEKARYESLKVRLVHETSQLLSRGTFKTAAGREEIRFRLDPALHNVPFEKMLHDVCREGKLVKIDGGYRIPNMVTRPSLQREQIMQALGEFMKNQRYATFSVGTFWKRHGEAFSFREVEKILNYLHAKKKIVRLNDDRFITTEAIQEIQDKVRDLILRKGTLRLQDAREILGYGRTRAIPVLDYLDSIGFTCRIGAERTLNHEAALSDTSEQGIANSERVERLG